MTDILQQPTDGLEGFLGDWRLDVEASEFGQGDPPLSGRMQISRLGEDLVFEIAWEDGTDREGARHEERLVARPDGRPEAFNGADLADALATRSPTAGVLETVASWRGTDRMSVVRTLSLDAMSMFVVQTVTLPDATEVTNRSVYRRLQ